MPNLYPGKPLYQQYFGRSLSALNVKTEGFSITNYDWIALVSNAAFSADSVDPGRKKCKENNALWGMVSHLDLPALGCIFTADKNRYFPQNAKKNAKT